MNRTEVQLLITILHDVLRYMEKDGKDLDRTNVIRKNLEKLMDSVAHNHGRELTFVER